MNAIIITKKLNQAKKALNTAISYLLKAKNAEDEKYYFEAVWRWAEMVNKLEIQLIKLNK